MALKSSNKVDTNVYEIEVTVALRNSLRLARTHI